MRYRLDVVTDSVAELVQYAGGWLIDRAMAGWDVTVLISGAADLRPLEILGVAVADLEDALAAWAERPHPQTVAVSSALFGSDARIREGVLNALGQGMTEVTLWGTHWPDELDTVGSVEHHLSAAARAFKAQALTAAGCDATVAAGHPETFLYGVTACPSVAADLVPAS